MNALIQQYQEDIKQLEDKLRAPGRSRGCLCNGMSTLSRKKSQEEIPPHGQHRAFSSSRNLKIESSAWRRGGPRQFRRKPTLDARFEELLVDDDIEKELQTLKSSLRKRKPSRRSTTRRSGLCHEQRFIVAIVFEACSRSCHYRKYGPHRHPHCQRVFLAKGSLSGDETRVIQKSIRLSKMEERIDALETILLDRERKGKQDETV